MNANVPVNSTVESNQKLFSFFARFCIFSTLCERKQILPFLSRSQTTSCFHIWALFINFSFCVNASVSLSRTESKHKLFSFLRAFVYFSFSVNENASLSILESSHKLFSALYAFVYFSFCVNVNVSVSLLEIN